MALKQPALPVAPKSVKVGKSATIAAVGGKTLDGLEVYVTTSSATCSVRATAGGYAITGVKAGSCQIKIAVVGNAAFRAASATANVSITK